MLRRLAGLHASTRRGRGQVAVVSGEAGIGKTALIDAFVESVPRGTRVLRGGCDPVVPRRPFAPIADIAAQIGPRLRDALANGDRDLVFDRFLAVVRDLRPGSVIVIEDLHWADGGTLDLVHVVGRRLPRLSILLIVSARDGPNTSNMGDVLGDLPVNAVSQIDLSPLSLEAVTSLASGTGLDPVRLHSSTGGNPFFLTELLASGERTLPLTIRDAVAARIRSLTPNGRRAIYAASVLGSGVDTKLIVGIAPDAAIGGIRECVQAGLLVTAGRAVSFRHELVRNAVVGSMGAAERRALHGAALAALRTGVVPSDPLQLARHAIEAGDAAAIAELAPPAASVAERLGANAEAADLLGVAIAIGPSGDAARAVLLERFARASALCDRVAAALTAQEASLGIWRTLGDQAREGSGLRVLSWYLWLAGEGDRALEVAESAVALLERVSPASGELAEALATVAQRRLLASQDDEETARWATRALVLAEDLGDDAVAVHALTTRAVALTYATRNGWDDLSLALERARSIGDTDAVFRVLMNFVETAADLRKYGLAERYALETYAFLEDREPGLYRHLIDSRVAMLALELGRWRDAEHRAAALLSAATPSSLVRARALSVLGRLRARRGANSAWEPLDEALALIGPREIQEIRSVRAARAELAWLEGDLDRCATEAASGLSGSADRYAWWFSELSFWLWRAGKVSRLPDDTERPFLLHAAGEFRLAAEAWAEIGCPYQQADALGDSGEEADLREALGILHALGATALAARVTRALRTLGASGIPRGPRPGSRANAAGLSPREMEVLAMLASATNAEIAGRLVISPRTVDHHVSSILRKLGVDDRASAVRTAGRLGLQDGQSLPPE